MFENILESVKSGKGVTLEQARALLAVLDNNPDAMLDLLALARLTVSRFAASGAATAAAPASAIAAAPAPFTCGIINAKSGRCAENCSFCAQSRYHATASPVYPLVDDEVLLERARLLAENGVDYMGIVISGTGPSDKDFERICAAAQRIIGETGIKLCASLGILGMEQAVALKQAGFTSYHHNLETSRSFYPEICGTHGVEIREQTVANARVAGLRVCSGGIFGLGESWEQRLEMAETLRELNVDSIPVNFLNPIPGTPLENAATLPPREALMVIALFRLMHPGRDIVICGGRGKVLGDWDKLIFSAGANGMMVGDYLTTKGSPFERDLAMLEELGVRSRDVAGFRGVSAQAGIGDANA
ncbi:biotin synthase BioB [Desulfovibrio sp. OttesenSCG-928-C06]|nr:biotin synthase BioB [Desulfovibrio sp. OttesenSCG-928-C06]